jgi:hypothetical protein
MRGKNKTYKINRRFTNRFGNRSCISYNKEGKGGVNIDIMNIIKNAQHQAGADEWRPPELMRLIDEVADFQQRKWDNEHLILRERRFDEAPCVATPCKRTQEIIDAIKALNMPLTVFEGEASGHYWTGDKLSKKEPFSIPQVMIKDEHGNRLEFDIEEFELDEPAQPFVNYGKIHATMFTVETQRQGSYYSAKRFIIGKIKRLLLDHIGYNTLYGRATWSINTEVKGNPAKEDDWRWQFQFVGWDSKLNAIFINKLVLFYYRMGYVADPYQATDVIEGQLHPLAQRTVVLMSDAAMERIKDWMPEEGFYELIKYNKDNAAEWRKLQRQREKELSPKEQEEAKAAVLASCIADQHRLDELW